MRRFYLPGLEGLKLELRKLEWLMERRLPALTAHLSVSGPRSLCFLSFFVSWWRAGDGAAACPPTHPPTHHPHACTPPFTPPPHPPPMQAHGVVPVLFASQWFLTAFSCPFPVSFACRCGGLEV